jgi:hypothetical protein
MTMSRNSLRKRMLALMPRPLLEELYKIRFPDLPIETMKVTESLLLEHWTPEIQKKVIDYLKRASA